MIAADTNIMVRVLVDDPEQPEQVAIARRLASEAKQLFVAQIVAVEMVWVLQSAYKLDKSTIVQLLEHLLHNSALHYKPKIIFWQHSPCSKNIAVISPIV